MLLQANASLFSAVTNALCYTLMSLCHLGDKVALEGTGSNNEIVVFTVDISDFEGCG